MIDTELIRSRRSCVFRKHLKVGHKADLPADYMSKAGGEATPQAQKELRQAVVNFGGGADDIEKLEDWIDKNIQDIALLCDAYGAVPSTDAVGNPEKAFILKKLPGTKSFERA